MSASFTKLKTGSWGVRVEGRPVSVGDVITVAKKSGETSEVTITRIVWCGTGVQLCAIEDTRRLCAGGCGSRVSRGYAECRSCERESLEAICRETYDAEEGVRCGAEGCPTPICPATKGKGDDVTLTVDDARQTLASRGVTIDAPPPPDVANYPPWRDVAPRERPATTIVVCLDVDRLYALAVAARASLSLDSSSRGPRDPLRARLVFDASAPSSAAVRVEVGPRTPQTIALLMPVLCEPEEETK